MKRWLVFVLPLALGVILPLSATAQDDLDWLSGDSAADEGGEEAEADSGDEGGKGEDEFVEEEEDKEDKKKEEKKAVEVSVGTEEPDENEKYVAAGRLHTFLGVGYAIPVADLTGDGVGFNNAESNTSGSVLGGLPIWFGADYFVIDDLAVGLKLRITPLFTTGGDDSKATLFDLHAQLAYQLLLPGLRLYLGLGYSHLGAKIVDEETLAPEAHSFSFGPGLSYTFYLTEIGGGGLGLEIGAEYVMMVGPDFNSWPSSGTPGTLADKFFSYPLFFIGLRYALGL